MPEGGIPSASITGFGFFDHERRDYEPKEFDEMEVTGLSGTLAWKDGKPAIHAHAAAAGRDFRSLGGHLLGLTVGRGSFEITIALHDSQLERNYDEKIGANILPL